MENSDSWFENIIYKADSVSKYISYHTTLVNH